MAGLTKRRAKLRQMLLAHRDTARLDVLSRLRHGRAGPSAGPGDEIDVSDARTQGDLDLALLELTSDRLARLDAAIARLDRGEYGLCVECDEAIADRRLHVVPFATRCRNCEDQRERQAHRRSNALVQDGSSL